MSSGRRSARVAAVAAGSAALDCARVVRLDVVGLMTAASAYRRSKVNSGGFCLPSLYPWVHIQEI
jgi:hypothetical protein